ncbi:hypothetical protein RAD16_28360 [Bradyrhizobium sp. 18BD]
MKTENAPSFRMMEWRLACGNKKLVPLTYAAEIDGAAGGKSTIQIAADAEANKQIEGSAVRSGKYEFWRDSIDPDMIKTLLASRALHVRQTMSMPDDKTDTAKFDIDLTGLASAWTQLAAACASVTPAPNSPWSNIPLPSADAKPSGLQAQ